MDNVPGFGRPFVFVNDHDHDANANSHRIASSAATNPSSRAMTSSLMSIILILGFLVHKASSIQSLTAQEFYNLKDLVDLVADVRGHSEWDRGHIEGAMFVEALSSYDTDYEVTTPLDLAGCEYCDIIAYCRSGARAGRALQVLLGAGFKGRLYNGEGVSQWKEANYTLVDSPSVTASCTYDAAVSDQCYKSWLSRQQPETVIVLEERVNDEAEDSGSPSSIFSSLTGTVVVGATFALFLYV